MFLVWVRSGVQRHHELAGDVRAVEVGSEQPEHVQLAFAQRLDQALGAPAAGSARSRRRRRRRPAVDGRSVQAARCLATALSRERHRWSLADEHADVALRFGQGQRAVQRRERSRECRRGRGG